MTYKPVPHAVKRSESLNTRHSRGQFLCPRKVSILQKEVSVLIARKEIRYVLPTDLFRKSLFSCRIKSGTKQQKEQTNSGLHDKVKKKLKWQTNPSLLLSHHILRFVTYFISKALSFSESIGFISKVKK